MNLEQLDWDQEALHLAGITVEQLSRLVPTTYKMEGLEKDYAVAMGLSEATPFIIGAADGVLSNLGVNAIQPGVVAVTIGTSGAIRTVIDQPVTDPQGRTFCYALTERHWVIGGAVNNGGMLLRWVRDEWAASEVETAKQQGVDVYDVLTEMAGAIRAGSDGLLFHPYLTGERAPLWNPDARGSFFGLTMRHGKAHLIRSVMEGVIFNLYAVLLAMEGQMGQPVQLLATGGFARSPLWRQIMRIFSARRLLCRRASRAPVWAQSYSGCMQQAEWIHWMQYRGWSALQMSIILTLSMRRCTVSFCQSICSFRTSWRMNTVQLPLFSVN